MIKKIMLAMMVSFFLISQVFAYEVEISDLEEDFTDYQVKRTLIQSIELSALSDGTLYGEPEKTKQVTLFDGMTKLRYPTGFPEMYLKYSFFANDRDYCPEPDMTCIKQVLVDEQTKHIVNGKDEKGDTSIIISNHMLNGVRLAMLEYHYVKDIDRETAEEEPADEPFIEYPLKSFKIDGNKIYKEWVISIDGKTELRLIKTCTSDEIPLLYDGGNKVTCTSIDDSNIIGQNNDGSFIYSSDSTSEAPQTQGGVWLDDLFDNAQYNTDNGFVEMQNGQCPQGYVGISTEKGIKCTAEQVSYGDGERDDSKSNDSTDYSLLWVALLSGSGFFLARKGGYI